MAVAEMLIWGGAAVTLLGVVGLAAVVVFVLRVKKCALPEEDMRRALQKGVAWNMAALFVSVLGLMAVIVGITLG